MLKAFLGFVVSVVVLLSSVYVPPAYAASADVMITQIQAGGSGAATQEFIVLYNNSSDELDMAGWCLTHKNAVAIACFSIEPGQSKYLPAYGHAVIVSAAFAATFPSVHFSLVYVPLSQSSGSITGGSDTISLIDHNGIIDSYNWTTSIPGGMQFERHKLSAEPSVYVDTDTSSDWSITTPSTIPPDETQLVTTPVDVCPNVTGNQNAIPLGMEIDGTGGCSDSLIIPLSITELLPNAVGIDTGNEFIEFYNPNDFEVNLFGFLLSIGPQLNNSFSFPAGEYISAHSYKSFSNNQIPFTLLNTTAKVVLTTSDGRTVSEIPDYIDPKEGASWALINEVWRYTHSPTPGAKNIFMFNNLSDDSMTILPCATNQYRSPDTNHCRLIATSNVAPCKDNQYRSEETNRCRTISVDAKIIVACSEGEERNATTNRCRKIVSAAAPAACKEGQERNLETNRCRTIVKMPTAEYAVPGTKAENTGNWYVWGAIAVLFTLAVGYAVWEWHHELGTLLHRLKKGVLRFARLHK